MKKIVLFDFDYTLADSSKGVYACVSYALVQMGESKCGWDECCDTIGLHLKETYERLTGKSDPESADTFYRLFLEKADQVMADNTYLYEGIAPMAEVLGVRGITLGILSTKFRSRIRQILNRYGCDALFPVIVGGEDVVNPKPDPEGLKMLLSRIGGKDKDTVLVGDSLTDAETARRGNIDFIAVLSGRTDRSAFVPFKPLAVIKSVVELPDILSNKSSIG